MFFGMWKAEVRVGVVIVCSDTHAQNSMRQDNQSGQAGGQSYALDKHNGYDTHFSLK